MYTELKVKKCLTLYVKARSTDVQIGTGEKGTVDRPGALYMYCFFVLR